MKKGFLDAELSIRMDSLLATAASAMNKKLESILVDYMLSRNRLRVLQLCSAAHEGLTPKELADILDITQATMSGIIKALDSASYIDKSLNVEDKKSYRITVTPRGQEVMNEVLSKWRPITEAFWDQFGSDDIDYLRNFLLRAENFLPRTPEEQE